MQALEQLSDKALPEWAAFAATLARRLAELLPGKGGGGGRGGGGGLALGDPIWKACVDQFLLKAVDIDSQVTIAVADCPFFVGFPGSVCCLTVFSLTGGLLAFCFTALDVAGRIKFDVFFVLGHALLPCPALPSSPLPCPPKSLGNFTTLHGH